MMGAACEMPNPSPKWQDLAIQKLNRHGKSIFGETRKKFGILTQEPGRIARFPNTLVPRLTVGTRMGMATPSPIIPTQRTSHVHVHTVHL
jgi:hypothetical protein